MDLYHTLLFVFKDTLNEKEKLGADPTEVIAKNKESAYLLIIYLIILKYLELSSVNSEMQETEKKLNGNILLRNKSSAKEPMKCVISSKMQPENTALKKAENFIIKPI